MLKVKGMYQSVGSLWQPSNFSLQRVIPRQRFPVLVNPESSEASNSFVLDFDEVIISYSCSKFRAQIQKLILAFTIRVYLCLPWIMFTNSTNLSFLDISHRHSSRNFSHLIYSELFFLTFFSFFFKAEE